MFVKLFLTVIQFRQDEIITKQKIPFNFALLLRLTCGINMLFFIFLGIFTDLFSILFINSYYISDEG